MGFPHLASALYPPMPGSKLSRLIRNVTHNEGTLNSRNVTHAMTDQTPTKPHRGRPASGTALSAADRQKRYRDRQRAKLAQAAPEALPLAVAERDQARAELALARDELHQRDRKIAELEKMVAEANQLTREAVAMAKEDRLAHGRLKAMLERQAVPRGARH